MCFAREATSGQKKVRNKSQHNLFIRSGRLGSGWRQQEEFIKHYGRVCVKTVFKPLVCKRGNSGGRAKGNWRVCVCCVHICMRTWVWQRVSTAIMKWETVCLSACLSPPLTPPPHCHTMLLHPTLTQIPCIHTQHTQRPLTGAQFS